MSHSQATGNKAMICRKKNHRTCQERKQGNNDHVEQRSCIAPVLKVSRFNRSYCHCSSLRHVRPGSRRSVCLWPFTPPRVRAPEAKGTALHSRRSRTCDVNLLLKKGILCDERVSVKYIFRRTFNKLLFPTELDSVF